MMGVTLRILVGQASLGAGVLGLSDAEQGLTASMTTSRLSRQNGVPKSNKNFAASYLNRFCVFGCSSQVSSP